jgi:uncharacterized alpha/beta hydrolase family protein
MTEGGVSGQILIADSQYGSEIMSTQQGAFNASNSGKKAVHVKVRHSPVVRNELQIRKAVVW